MMKKNNRPLSPHIEIYKPQISSMLSILHRITGASLFFIFLIGANIVNFDILLGTHYAKLVIDCEMVKLLFVPVIFIFYYHILNGIRHLFWDYGLFLSLKGLHVTGYLVMFGAVILTITSVWALY